MRWTSICRLFWAGCLFGVAAQADPGAPPDPKAWHLPHPAFPSAVTYREVEPNGSCQLAQVSQCGDVVDPAEISVPGDVDWYRLDNVPTGSILIVGTDQPEYGGPPYAVDAYISLMASDCTTILAEDDDSGPGSYSLISGFPAAYTGTYYVKIRHYSPAGTGFYRFMGDCLVPPPPPSNDTCAGAVQIWRCTSGSIMADLTWAVNDHDPAIPGPSCTGFSAGGRDLVYKMDLENGDQVQLVYNGNFDSSVYIVSDCGDVSSSCLVGVDTYPNPPGELLAWSCVTSGTYYIICDAYAPLSGGAFVLDYTINCAPPLAACCSPEGTCRLVLESDCPPPEVWRAFWPSCTPNPCPPAPPPAVCCSPEGSCRLSSQADCLAPDVWYGFWLSCSPNPCSLPTTGLPEPRTPPAQVERSSWGHLKSAYR